MDYPKGLICCKNFKFNNQIYLKKDMILLFRDTDEIGVDRDSGEKCYITYFTSGYSK